MNLFRGTLITATDPQFLKSLIAHFFQLIFFYSFYSGFLFNPLNANPEKWSNTLKQIVGNLPTICLSVFDHFMNLALKGLKLLFDTL